MAKTDAIPDPPPRGIYRRLLVETAQPHLRDYLVVALLLLSISATTAALAWVMDDVVNGVFSAPASDRIASLALLILTIFVLRGLATFGSAVLLARIGNQIVADLQGRVLTHLQRQDLAYYESRTLGDVAVLFVSNAQSARSAIELIVQSIGRDVLTLIALLGVMVAKSPELALSGLLILPPSVLALRWLTTKARAVSKASIAANARLLGHMSGVHQGVRVIKSFTLEPEIHKQISTEIDRVRDLSNRAVRYVSLTSPVLDLIVGLAVAGVVIWSGTQITSGELQPGAIVSFLTALLLAYAPARRLARFQVQLQTHMVGAEMMFAFLDREAVEATSTASPAPDLSATDVRFDAVQFSYGETVDPNISALNGLDLDCPQGSTTALVGASGAGKSTIFDLLLRLRTPDRGQIRIGGTPIDQIPLATLRKTIAVVPQQTFLFDTTIRENIRCGRPDASDAEVHAAAQAANAEAFILQEPQGYDRWINDAAGLSGGERQRIAIARALLKDAPILLLDEATAALDSESERLVQDAIATLGKGRTLLVIAHRLSTIRNADTIHVIDAGCILESGTHDILLAKRGAYARLIQLQAGGQTVNDADTPPSR